MQPLSGNHRPDLLTPLMKMSLVLRLPRNMQILFKMSHACHRLLEMPQTPQVAHFWEGAQSLAPAMRKHIWTSKSGANIWCFVHADFEMCFAPQQRALFQHLIFQKCSDVGVLCTFLLRHVLRATTACTFSTSQLPKVGREWCALYILTSKCGSRHNGVHFFDISTSKSDPNMWCFVHFDLEICFAPQWRANFHLSSGQMAPHPPALASLLLNPPEPQIIRKTQCFATFLPFRAPSSSFFWLFLFSDLLSSTLLFYSSLLSDSSHLCFLSVHLVGSLTSKLPSIKRFRGTPILGNLHKSVVLLQSNIATSSNHSFRIPFQGQAKNHLTPTTPTAFPGVTAEVLMGWLTIFFDREPLVFYQFSIRFSCKSSPHIPFIQLREW